MKAGKDRLEGIKRICSDLLNWHMQNARGFRIKIVDRQGPKLLISIEGESGNIWTAMFDGPQVDSDQIFQEFFFDTKAVMPLIARLTSLLRDEVEGRERE